MLSTVLVWLHRTPPEKPLFPPFTRTLPINSKFTDGATPPASTILVSTTEGLKTNEAQPTSKKHIHKTNGYRKKYNLPLPDNSSRKLQEGYIPTNFVIILQTLTLRHEFFHDIEQYFIVWIVSDSGAPNFFRIFLGSLHPQSFS